MRVIAITLLSTLVACGDTTTGKDGDTGGIDDESVDVDGDGVDASEDCDDADATTWPGAPEICDEVDNDCDGDVDEGVSGTWYLDGDDDGYGSAGETTQACGQPAGYAASSDDCDDSDPDVHPSAVEVCNDLDDDCDGDVDEGLLEVRYADGDGDGWGDDTQVIETCEETSGYVATGGDCDDTSDAVWPGAEETCDDLDNDCDGEVDEDATTTFYADVDGDGWGDAGSTTEACALPTGYAGTDGDCDDADGGVNPGASEVCNEVDDDCDGDVDEGVLSTFYADVDGDGWGDAGSTAEACALPTGYAGTDGDCDDAESAVNPGAVEVCNEVDDDCDGNIDDEDSSVSGAPTWYADSDSDGFGDPSASAVSCLAPSGYLAGASDCDDAAASVNPGAVEVCNSVDDDCDGDTDDADASLDSSTASTWYTDADGDGYGDDSATTLACDAPSGSADVGGDCDDADGTVNPDGLEVCDGVDNDCDGDVDWEVDALYFSASTDTVTIADAASLEMGSVGTIEAWVWLDGSGGVVYNKWVNGQEDHYLYVGTTGNAGGSLYKSAGSYISASSGAGAVASGGWAHVAFVWDGAEARMYVDGAEFGATAVSGEPRDSSGQAHIGGIYRDGGQRSPMQGWISDVMLSDTVRYTTDFTPDPEPVADGDTLALWALDEGSGTTASDGSGNGNDGVISGATWMSTTCRPD